MKSFVVKRRVVKKIVFIAEKRSVFVLGQKLTVVKANKEIFIVYKRSKKFLQKREPIFPSLQSSSRGSVSSAFERRLAFVKQAHRPAILTLCAEKFIVFVRACHSHRVCPDVHP